MVESTSARYAALVAAGDIERDRAQDAIIEKLSHLNDRLSTQRLARKSSSLGWLFGNRDKAAPELKGVYIWGDVGRGKTLLMDLFFATCPIRRKRRVHFHQFMLDVHERLDDVRRKLKRGDIPDADPIRLVADELADEAWVLCFDEFQVTDIADAMILGRLFFRLFERSVIIVATSNVEPTELYQGGLNRALFLPFIRMLTDKMEVMRLEARTDFRIEKLHGMKVWLVPADAAATRALDEAWRRLTGGNQGHAMELTAKGHVVRVPCAAMGAARFGFADLCEAPLAAVDYLRIAREFHTVLIDRVPVMSYAERNAAKRFIILIDTLYEAGIKLLASADAEPDALYRAAEGFEVNEFKRTASRLIEMGSSEYLAMPSRGQVPVTPIPTGLVNAR